MQTYSTAHNNPIKLHMDGARIFNASVYLNESVEKMTKYARRECEGKEEIEKKEERGRGDRRGREESDLEGVRDRE